MKAIVYALIFSGLSGLKSCSESVILQPKENNIPQVKVWQYDIPKTDLKNEIKQTNPED